MIIERKDLPEAFFRDVDTESYYHVGIDNGVTGSIAAVDRDGRLVMFLPTPVEMRQDYTKKKELNNRVKAIDMAALLRPFVGCATVMVERPVTTKTFHWKTIKSGLRADEATRVVIEVLGMRYGYVDSREWQKLMLPDLKVAERANKDATPEEKKAIKARNAQLKKQTKILSLEVGKRLFPGKKFKDDADAPLIAEWSRRTRQ